MARKQENPPTTHTVESGDKLFDIAQAYYGDSNQWPTISDANGNIQPQSLQIGQQLQIPAVDSPLPNGNGFTNIVSRQIYEAMFPNRNSLYSYDALVSATQKYPSFCNEVSAVQRKREAAAFLAHIVHETTGGLPTPPEGPYAWGLYFIEEQNPQSQYCESSNSTYPCVLGKSYYGRRPLATMSSEVAGCPPVQMQARVVTQALA